MYIVMAYLSNGDDYCRGCHMGSSDSDFGWKRCDTFEEVYEFARGIYEGEAKNYPYSSYELTVVGEDGHEVYYDHTRPEEDDNIQTIFNRIRNEAYSTKKRREEAERTAAAFKANRARIDREKAELARLLAIHGQ